MKKSLFVMFLLSFSLSFVFGQETTEPLHEYTDIGGAIETEGVPVGKFVTTSTRKNGYVELYLKNASVGDATNLEFYLCMIKVDGSNYLKVRAVLNRTRFEPRANENAKAFYEVTDESTSGYCGPYRVCQPNRDTDDGKNANALLKGGMGTFCTKIEYYDTSETPPVWKIAPAIAELHILIYWTKGMYSDNREPIMEATSDPESESCKTDVEDIKDNLENSNAPFCYLDKKVTVGTANDENNSTAIVLPDILMASVSLNELKDGTITITNPYGLPLEMNTETSVFVMPFLPGGVEIIEETDDETVLKFKKYLNINEGGGVFKNPDIITDIKINENNEFEFKLCTTLDSGVPWARKDLKPGAFMIKGLILRIGGGLGSVAEWAIDDKLYVGAKGDMIWEFDIDKVWHVISIIANE